MSAGTIITDTTPSTTTATPLVRVDGVTRQFGEVTALDNVSVDLGREEFVSVVGASGCGKSTLLSIIAGLDYPTQGTVTMDGAEVQGPGRDRGVVFQTATLLPWLTVEDNVIFALRGEAGMSKAERRNVAREHLDHVGLTGFEDKYPSQLSGGMQQRVALARSLSYHPDVLLMDEPFGALDMLTRRAMQQLLTRVWEENRMTVMLITHDIEEAVFTSDRVVVMSARPGTIKAEVPIDLERPRDEEVLMSAEFREYYSGILGMIDH